MQYNIIVAYNIIIPMISAKNQAFRQQIRRRQIQDKFRARRKQYIEMQQILISREQQHEFITEIQNILFNLIQVQNDDYYLYQNLIDLKNILKKKYKLVPVICRGQYLIIQSISQVMGRINSSQLQKSRKYMLFQFIITIMSDLIQCQTITSQRIIKSQFLQKILPYLQNLDTEKQTTLEQLFSFLANCTRQSLHIATLYTQLSIPKHIIKIIKQNNIQQHSKIIKQFLFFLRSYYEQVKDPIKLTEQQIGLCINVSSFVIDDLCGQDLKKRQLAEELEDALKVYKSMIDYQRYQFDAIDSKRFVQIVQTRNYPLQIKRQALYVIDGIIFVANQQTTKDIVYQTQLLNNIWGVDEQIKYILFNIFANVAVIPALRQQIMPFMPRIRLEMVLNPDKKFIYRCVLNYLKAQKFSINGTLDQSLINQLYKSQNIIPQVMEIQASIWLGLIMHGFDQRIPSKILQAKNIPAVQQIWYILERYQNISSTMEDMYDQQGKVINQ